MVGMLGVGETGITERRMESNPIPAAATCQLHNIHALLLPLLLCFNAVPVDLSGSQTLPAGIKRVMVSSAVAAAVRYYWKCLEAVKYRDWHHVHLKVRLQC